MSRRITRCLKELQGVKLSRVEHIEKWLDDSVFLYKIRDGYYNIKTFLVNLRIFIPIAWRWRNWDYNYNIEVFTKLLEETGKHMINHGNTVNSKKMGRRALIASAKLNIAYGNFDNKTLNYVFKRHGFSFMRNYSPKVLEHIIQGIIKAADKREDAIVEERKKEAWNYLNKYIEYFWD